MPETQISPEITTDLRELAADVVRRAMATGASAAEAVIQEGDEFSTVVRLGEVETLKEAGSRALGVRVFFGKRTASTYTSDLTLDGIEKLVSSARDLAQITSEDSFSGLPDAALLGQHKGDLNLFHPDVYSLPGTERIDHARRAEKASLDYDPRIKNSEGVRSTLPPAIESSLTRWVSWANTAGLSALLSPFRSCNPTTAPCSATTGTTCRAVSRILSLLSTSGKSPRSGHYGVWARAK